ncbi:hypothetical protein ABAC460_14305 [Asticcacaulis sp. AC460]|uniref:YbjN domain-containing protein n=1 Tax=Asticcacaulis sp. AC460 TaxID=1282360 RepID=UPI0003C3EA55|nr:YbjN domain-containing protein [Asticcacaulis sp. AC460]ESQ88950.1 hypothetical protein ABAC460_14305 [Asticcacaulis sp. AC460]
MIKTVLFTAVAASFALATPLLAKDYPNGGVTGAEVAADLKGIDQTADVGKDSAGDPLVTAAFKVGDTSIDYKIFFYGCKEGRCTSIQYHVAFDGDVSKVAEWNKSNRFARAYVTDKSTIHLEYDVDVEKGANTAAIQNSAQRFIAVMVQGVKVLG